MEPTGGRGRPRGRPRGGQARHEQMPEQNPQEQHPPEQNPMQQMLGIINELRAEVRELREKQNEDRRQVTTDKGEQGERSSQSGTQQLEQQDNRGEETAQYWVAKFCKHQPPVFRGKFDPQAAEDWLMRLEKIFQVLECPDDKKAQLAIYKLEGDADRWWRNTEMTLRARNTPITWEMFQEKFNEKYFPRSVKIAKESEFLAVRQGNDESFDEYLARFIRLSRYSTYLRYRDDESWSADMLIRGLRPEIKERLISRQFRELNQAVEECRIVEGNLNEMRVVKGGMSRSETSRENFPQKRKGQGFKPQGDSKRPFQSGSRAPQRPPTSQVCSRCGTTHPGKNCAGQAICFLCQKPGHFKLNCPQRATEKRPQS